MNYKFSYARNLVLVLSCIFFLEKMGAQTTATSDQEGKSTAGGEEVQSAAGVAFSMQLDWDSTKVVSNNATLYFMYKEQIMNHKDFCNYFGINLQYPEELKSTGKAGSLVYELHFDYGQFTEAKLKTGFEGSELFQKEVQKHIKKLGRDIKLLQDKHVVLTFSVEARLV